jgi:hypothetical protein
MGEFKKGDRVTIIAKVPYFSIGIGSTGTITSIRNGVTGVKWDSNLGKLNENLSVSIDSIKLIKKGAKLMKKERKKYPSKFYVQRCMTNDDPTDLLVNVTPEAVEFDMAYPMLEITSTKKGFKIREVEVGIRRTVTVKEVK